MSLNHASPRFFYPLFLLTFIISCSTSSYALNIPSSYGEIKERREGTQDKTILLIQEAHVDYGAQKSIAAILKHLIELEGLRLVLVEGGWGNVNLAYLRNYGSREGRVQVAEQYLKEGRISAEEYLDVTTELDFEIWGVEDKALYDANMRAFLAIHEKQPALLEEVSKIRAELAKQEESIFSKDLRELIARKETFEEGKFSLVDYLQILASEENRHSEDGRSPDEESQNRDASVVRQAHHPERSRGTSPQHDELVYYPHLRNLLTLSGGDSHFDIEKVDYEKSQLIKALSHKLTKPEFELLSVLSEKKSAEDEIRFLKSLLEYHKKFPDLAKKTPVDNLAAYVKSLEEAYSGVDSAKVFEELAAFEIQIIDRLAVTPEAKELLGKIRTLAGFKKLFELKLTPEEFSKVSSEGVGILNDGNVSGAAVPTSQAIETHQSQPSQPVSQAVPKSGLLPSSEPPLSLLFSHINQDDRNSKTNTPDNEHWQSSGVKDKGRQVDGQKGRQNLVEIFSSFFGQFKHEAENSVTLSEAKGLREGSFGPSALRMTHDESPNIEKAIPLAKAFYKAATKREEALVRNAIEKLESSGLSQAALIIGGFHAQEILNALYEKGCSVVLISPRFQPESSTGPAGAQQKYFEILKQKWNSHINDLSQGGMNAHAIQKAN